MSHIVRPTLRGQSSTFTTLDNDGLHGALSRFEAKVHDVSIQQDDLSETRQQVLIDRQRVASSARQIQRSRYNTAGKEARLMDIFRKYFTDLGESIPEDLVLAYSEVEHSRKDLAATEDAHNNMEQGLELSELTLTEQENDLYQLMLPSLLHNEDHNDVENPKAICESATELNPQSQQAAVSGVDNNRRPALDFLADDWSFGDWEFPKGMHVAPQEQIVEDTPHPRLPRELRSQDVPVQATASSSTGLNDDRKPHGSIFADKLLHQPTTAPHQHHLSPATVGGPLSVREETRVTPSVSDWILKYLKMNATEKLHLVAILRAETGNSSHRSLDFDHWSDVVEEFWTQGNTESPVVSNTEKAQSELHQDKVLVPRKPPSDQGNPSSFSSHDWFLSSSYDFSPYSPRKAELEMRVPQVQSDILPMENYGYLDLENETDPQQSDGPTTDPQAKPTLPVLQVTIPEDELFFEGEPRYDNGRLSPMGTSRRRWDSVHNSEADNDQDSSDVRAKFGDDHHSIKENSSATPGLSQTRHKKKEHDIVPSAQGPEDIAYAEWVRLQDLNLFSRNGSYRGYEVVESEWREGRDALNMGRHEENLQERIIADSK